MEHSGSASFGCRIVAEYEDDLSQFKASGGEIRPAYSFQFPSEEAALAAKQHWLKIIGRFTEPIPDKPDRLRVREAAAPHRGIIHVQCGGLDLSRSFPDRPLPREYVGSVIDVTDNMCLTLFGYGDPGTRDGDPEGMVRVRESSTPIPWTDIVNISFELTRLVPEKSVPGE